MNNVPLDIVVLPHAAHLPRPEYATDGSCAFDLRAAIDAPMEVDAGNKAMVPLGISVQLPPGTALLLLPRSGFSNKRLMLIPNSPGLIDTDYTGQLLAGFWNANGWGSVTIEPGERVVQALLVPFFRAEFNYVSALKDTARGAGGFGSTGSA